MKRQNVLWTLSAVAHLSACSFLLDFEELRHPPAAPGSSSGATPDASPILCASACVAKDSCFESHCVEGKCVETPIVGFVPDKDERDITADKLFRTTTTAGDGKLFAATYGIFDGKRDIVIRSFDTASGELQEARVSASEKGFLGEEIGSPAGLVVVDKHLNVYFATRPPAGSSLPTGKVDLRAGKVWHLRYTSAALEAKLPASAADTANFRFNGDTLGPSAGMSEGTAFVVWPGCTTTDSVNCLLNEPDSGSRAGIYLQKANEQIDVLNEKARINETSEITDLVALSGPKPGAAWLANPPDRIGALLTGYEGFAAQPLNPVCNKSAVFTGRVLSATGTPAGDLLSLWASGYTGPKPASQWYQLKCNGVPCLLDEKPSTARCEVPIAPAGAWASAVSAYQPRTEENVYLVGVHLAQSGPNIGVSLSLSPFTEQADAGAPTAGATALLPASDAENLDWPSVAVGSDGHALVSWQTRDKDGNDVLHLSRQRVCTGAPARP